MYIAMMLFFLIVACDNGCAIIPAGTETLSTNYKAPRVTDSRHADEDYLSGDLVDGVATFQLQKITTIHEEQGADETITKRRKRLVVGLFPGIFADWYGGYSSLNSKKAKDSGDYVQDAACLMPFAVPLINGIVLGLPTILSWFEESGEPWKPPAVRKGGALVQMSLMGYAKTSTKEEEVLGTKTIPPRTRLQMTPLSNRELLISLSGASDVLHQSTDQDGKVQVNISELRGGSTGATAVQAKTEKGRLVKTLAIPPSPATDKEN